MTILGVIVGGGLGALARYHLAGLVSERNPSVLPLGTLVVNLTGSVLAGALTGLVMAGRMDAGWLPWAGVGFCGGLTTFSTFAYETAQLFEQGATGFAWWNLALSAALSFGGAAAGFLVGLAL